jgi:hypothetical protein
MLSSILYYKTAWNDYFPGTNPTTTLVPKEYTTTQSISDTYVYVSNCLFNGCSSSSNGGALCCSTSVTYLLVESSSFFSCKTSGSYGGAIYFSNTNSGECVLHKTCGNDCCSTSSSYGQCARIYVKNTASSKNYVNYSSITRCVNENSGSNTFLRLDYGRNYVLSVNISMNKCGYFSGISCSPFVNSNSITSSLSYSSFTDNIATGCDCIHFDSNNANYEIKCCNILRNSQNSLNSDGTIRFWGNTVIEDSCILENTATYTFNAGSSSYTVTLSNCTIDKTTINPGSLTIIKTVIKSFIHALNHISTQNCNAKYDSAGTLTPITPPPSSSSKNQNNCYTFNNFLYQSHFRDIISTMWVFVFNFIHPYDKCSQRIINIQVL